MATRSWWCALPLVLAAGAAGAKVDREFALQVGGVLSNACGNQTQPMVRLYDDVMSVEVAGKKVAATTFRTVRQSPVTPAPADFKVAFVGEVPGGDGLVFVLTHNKEGLFVTIVGGAKSLAPLGPGIVGARLRHCDPNRNALPGQLPAGAEIGPTSLLADAKFKSLYLKALGPLARERWLARLEGPAPGIKTVKVAGQDYTQAAVCKDHDCYDNSMLLLYSAAQGVVYVQVHQRGRDMALGAPPPAVAAELARQWKAQFRRQ